MDRRSPKWFQQHMTELEFYLQFSQVTRYQWIGLRENLNRKAWFLHVFTIKKRRVFG